MKLISISQKDFDKIFAETADKLKLDLYEEQEIWSHLTVDQKESLKQMHRKFHYELFASLKFKIENG